MARNGVWYFLVLFGTSGHPQDSKRGLLGASLCRSLGIFGASFGRLWGILVASLRRPRLGHPRLGLDLAKLAYTWLSLAKLGWNGWKGLETARHGWNDWKLLEICEIDGNG